MPEGIEFSSLRPEDLDFRILFFKSERQAYMRHHLENLISYNPEGCFLAVEGGKPVGMVTTTKYGGYGWIGWLFVLPYKRGRGTGSALTKRAIDHLQGIMVGTIRLEAVDEAVPLYKRLGFVEEHQTLHYLGKAVGAMEGSKVEDLGVEHIDALSRFDAKGFGADRRQILRRLAEGDQEKGLGVLGENGPLGYLFYRLVGDKIGIGPMVVETGKEGVARDLLLAVQQRYQDNDLYLRIPAPNKAGIKALKGLGLQFIGYKTTRMRLGSPGYEGTLSSIYSLGCPGKG